MTQSPICYQSFQPLPIPFTSSATPPNLGPLGTLEDAGNVSKILHMCGNFLSSYSSEKV